MTDRRESSVVIALSELRGIQGERVRAEEERIAAEQRAMAEAARARAAERAEAIERERVRAEGLQRALEEHQARCAELTERAALYESQLRDLHADLREVRQERSTAPLRWIVVAVVSAIVGAAAATIHRPGERLIERIVTVPVPATVESNREPVPATSPSPTATVPIKRRTRGPETKAQKHLQIDDVRKCENDPVCGAF